MIETESKAPRSRSGSTSGPLTPEVSRRLAKMDKAAVAFKVGI